MYSFAIDQAIKAAAVLHQGQVRKGSIPLPYITHVYTVAMLVADYSESENAVIAALLHDTLEDTDYTTEELTEDFGSEVAKIVQTLTEPSAEKYSWQDRKKQYVKQVKKGGTEVHIICAADKIHNMRTCIEDNYDDHVQFINDFGGTLEERVHFHQNISNILNAQLENDIVHEFNHVFTEYKNFIEDVKRTQENSRV